MWIILGSRVWGFIGIYRVVVVRGYLYSNTGESGRKEHGN